MPLNNPLPKNFIYSRPVGSSWANGFVTITVDTPNQNQWYDSDIAFGVVAGNMPNHVAMHETLKDLRDIYILQTNDDHTARNMEFELWLDDSGPFVVAEAINDAIATRIGAINKSSDGLTDDIGLTPAPTHDLLYIGVIVKDLRIRFRTTDAPGTNLTNVLSIHNAFWDG